MFTISEQSNMLSFHHQYQLLSSEMLKSLFCLPEYNSQGLAKFRFLKALLCVLLL